jgi:hypothetical protein
MAEATETSRLPTWREMNRDTTPEAEAFLFAYWREAPAWEKWQRMVELNHSARLLAVAGLRSRYPDASEAEIRRRLADLLLGPELAARVYGPHAFEAADA